MRVRFLARLGPLAFHCACLAIVVACFGAAPESASAQEDDYRRTIEQALGEFEGGNFAESLALFRRAHTMRPSARTLRGLGKASFELRRYVDAVNYFSDALTSTENALTDDQRTEVTSLLSRAQAFVGRYEVITDPEGASIAVDGNEAGRELVLDIGEHTIAASAAGHTTLSRRITVAGGEDERLTMTLESSTSEVVIEEHLVEHVVERVLPDPGEPLRVAGWVMGGVGVAVLGLGAGATAAVEVAHANYNGSTYSAANLSGGCPILPGGDWNAEIPETYGSTDVPPLVRTTRPDCFSLQSTWRTWDPVQYAGWIAGGTLLVTGVVFLVIGSVIGPGEVAIDTGPAASEARDVARGIAFVRRHDGPELAMGCGPFADLGVACSGRF